jgi:2-dehydro-3-deoxyphosphogluconate aldolase/(4S)-4-hydroxy-2-oxoglutarate aldolase
MRSRAEQVKRICDCGIVAVVRTDTSEELVDVSRALKNGGIDVIEITMTTPNALQVIADVSKVMGQDVLVGVGSVLDPETARAAILAGAEFIVAPTYSPAVVEMAHRYGCSVTPGAFTPSEVLAAWEGGADMVKIFPARVGGPKYMKDLRAPMPQLKLVPTGGVDITNAAEFIKAGAAALGVGSALVRKDAVKNKDFAALKGFAEEYVAEIRKARGL